MKSIIVLWLLYFCKLCAFGPLFVKVHNKINYFILYLIVKDKKIKIYSFFLEINQVDDELCGIKKMYEPFHETRRIADHTISGANQPCNHSCPFSCTDVFRPICAMIWHVGSDSKSLVKPMINHCHVDMFSCASGLSEYCSLHK